MVKILFVVVRFVEVGSMVMTFLVVQSSSVI